MLLMRSSRCTKRSGPSGSVAGRRVDGADPLMRHLSFTATTRCYSCLTRARPRQCTARFIRPTFSPPPRLSSAKSRSPCVHLQHRISIDDTDAPVSLQHHADSDIGVHVIDKYTHALLDFMEGVNKTSIATFADLVRPCLDDADDPRFPTYLGLLPFSQFETFTWDRVGSTHGVRTDLFPHDLSNVLVTDFFGGVASVEVDQTALPIAIEGDEDTSIDPPPFSRPVHREGLALGQARGANEERKLQAARIERHGKWIGWKADLAAESSLAKGGLLTRAGWAAAGIVLLGAGSWFGLKD